jgi:hypothetical protein
LCDSRFVEADRLCRSGRASVASSESFFVCFEVTEFLRVAGGDGGFRGFFGLWGRLSFVGFGCRVDRGDLRPHRRAFLQAVVGVLLGSVGPVDRFGGSLAAVFGFGVGEVWDLPVAGSVVCLRGDLSQDVPPDLYVSFEVVSGLPVAASQVVFGSELSLCERVWLGVSAPGQRVFVGHVLDRSLDELRGAFFLGFGQHRHQTDGLLSPVFGAGSARTVLVC